MFSKTKHKAENTFQMPVYARFYSMSAINEKK